MIEKQYMLNNEIYSLVPCVVEDIPSHTERVYPYWCKDKTTSISTQQRYMEYCIKEDTAAKIVCNGEDKAAIYVKLTSIDTATAYCCWFENKRMMAILMYYARFTMNLNLVRFYAHTQEYIPFKFLINKINIRLFDSHHVPLDVFINSRESRILHEDHFIRYGIKEL